MVQVASDELRIRRAAERIKPVSPPRYRVGEKVIERSDNKLATITLVYPFENEYRYVIQTTDGSELVCFEPELRRARYEAAPS